MRESLLPIKISWKLKKEEWYLFSIIFIWLFLSSIYLDGILKKRLIFEALPYIIFENYLTVCVYYGLKQTVWKGKIENNIFVQSLHFFLRILGYRLLFSFISGFLLMIPVALSVNANSVKAVNLIFFLSILWISVPVYYLVLTLYSPLIIIVEDIPLIESVIKSYNFIKKYLKELLILSIFLGSMWGFAIFLNKVYNYPIKFLNFALLSYLEIFTVKCYFNFDKLKREDERNI